MWVERLTGQRFTDEQVKLIGNEVPLYVEGGQIKRGDPAFRKLRGGP